MRPAGDDARTSRGPALQVEEPMLDFVWDTRGYFFWLLVVSVLCLVLERLRPWRPAQRVLRPQLAQDLFWLFWNGHYAGVLVASAGVALCAHLLPGFTEAVELHLVSTWPLAAQVVVFLVARDFLEWCIHNLLHRVGWLWTFHKVHHSIEQMDWIGNFRFHWMEVVVYRALTYLPLALVGASGDVILWVAVISTLIGHLNHSNLALSYGPMRYVLNSPRMHIWHHAHDLPPEHPQGANFGICLSVWDWLLGTAWWPSREESPSQQPPRLGFPGLEGYPSSLIGRFLVPLSLWGRGRAGAG